MKTVSKDATIKVYGVEFHGVMELKEYAIKGESKEGVYVGMDAELYPCFDSSDYAYEDRFFWNFVFARSKEKLQKKLTSLKGMRQKAPNYNKLTEGMAPMVYWQGDTVHPMLVLEEKCQCDMEKREENENNQSQTVKNSNVMKTRVFNLIILDESGSMWCIKQAAINSVNETIQTIREAEKEHEDQEHYVTFVSFNSKMKTICDCVPACEVKEITENDYKPNCNTALYDAMGMSLNALRPKVAESDRVLVTVITDGEENSSKEFTGKAIKALVDELKGKGWIFAYIGANQDVEKVAATISITNTMTFEATPLGTMHMARRSNDSRKNFFARLGREDFDAAKENERFFDV